MSFLSVRIVLSCLYMPIFYFDKFSTWNWRLLFAVNVTVNLSNVTSEITVWYKRANLHVYVLAVFFCLIPYSILLYMYM